MPQLILLSLICLATLVPVVAVWIYQDSVERRIAEAGGAVMHPTIREFVGLAKRRLKLWTIGVLAAILPNAAGLYDSSHAGGTVSASVVGTAASVLLIGAVSFADMARTLWGAMDRNGRPDPVRILGTGIVCVMNLGFGGYYTWLANRYPSGLPPQPPAFWWVLGASVVSNVVGELWMANTAAPKPSGQGV